MNSLIATLEARKPQIAALLPKDELVATIRAATEEAVTQRLTEPPRSVFGVKVPLIMDSEEMVPPGCAQAAYSWEIREYGRVIGRQHLIVRTPAEVTLTWDFRRFPEEANGIEPVIPRLDPEKISVPLEFETFTHDEEGNEMDAGMEYSPHFRLERASDLLVNQKPDHTLLGIKVRVVPVLLDTSTGRVVHTRDTRNERKPPKESAPPPTPPQTPIPVTPAKNKTPIQIDNSLYPWGRNVYLGTGKNTGHWMMGDQQGKFLVMPEQQHLSLEELKARGGEWIYSTWEARIAPKVRDQKSLVAIVDLGKGLLPYTATLDLKDKNALWKVRDNGIIYFLHPDSKSANQRLFARVFEYDAAEAGVGWIGDIGFRSRQSEKAQERKSLSTPAKQAIDDLVLATVKSYRSGADVPLIAEDLYENQGGVKNTLHLGDAYTEGASVQFTPTEDDGKILFQISYDKNKRKEIIQASIGRLEKKSAVYPAYKDKKGRVQYKVGQR